MDTQKKSRKIDELEGNLLEKIEARLYSQDVSAYAEALSSLQQMRLAMAFEESAKRVADSLERIADALEQQNAPVRLANKPEGFLKS